MADRSAGRCRGSPLALQRVLSPYLPSASTIYFSEESASGKPNTSALLCRLSYHDQCRKNMMEDGLVKAVIALSKVNDFGTQHRCVSVLCNLACEGAMRATLIKEGAEKALVSLSSSYNEAIRQGCAATLCNLACDEECQQATWPWHFEGQILLYYNALLPCKYAR